MVNVCLPEPNLSIYLFLSTGVTLLFNSKTKTESYIFYKLSAYKKDAKIETINTVQKLSLSATSQPGLILIESKVHS